VVQHRPERVQRRLAAGAHSHQLLGLQGGRGLGPQAPGVNKGSATAVGDEAERPGHHLADLGVQIQEGVVLGTNESASAEQTHREYERLFPCTGKYLFNRRCLLEHTLALRVRKAYFEGRLDLYVQCCTIFSSAEGRSILGES
jgi:hypothetical protein